MDDEALYMQYRATLSPLEQKQAEDILADARAALHQIPPNVYSAVEIATYHARLNHTHLLESSFWVSGDQHVSTLRQRLLDGGRYDPGIAEQWSSGIPVISHQAIA